MSSTSHLQSEALALLRLLRVAARTPAAVDQARTAGGSVRLAARWLGERDWWTPYQLLEDVDEFTAAATLRRLGSGDETAIRWRLAESLT